MRLCSLPHRTGGHSLLMAVRFQGAMLVLGTPQGSFPGGGGQVNGGRRYSRTWLVQILLKASTCGVLASGVAVCGGAGSR